MTCLKTLLGFCYVIIAIVETARAQFYFYPCNYHGQVEPSGTNQAVTFAIQGNPHGYKPGQVYHVTVTSGSPFTFLVITGVVTSSATSQVALADNSFDPGFQCLHIHTTVSPSPVTEITFYWLAPPGGSGCVSIVARASMRSQVLYNDVTIHQICEEGTGKSPPILADVHTTGIILRDDFDSGDFNEMWSSDRIGVSIGQQCGQIMFADAAMFCDVTAEHSYITTKPMNLSTAASLQWSIGSGSCHSTENHLKILYRLPGDSHDWLQFKSVKVPSSSQPSVTHVTSIPQGARQNDVTIRFAGNVTEGGCWGVDNIVIVNSADRPIFIEDDFDPIESNNWLFMPGGFVRHGECSSKRNALVFDANVTRSYVTSRDIDLSEGDPDGSDVTDMIRSGGTIEVGVCGHKPGEVVRLFNGPGSRTYCTHPDLDLSNKMAAKFTLSIGGGNCSRSNSHNMDVQYYYVTKQNVKHVIKNFHFDAYRVPKNVIVPIPNQAQTPGATICFGQRSHKGQGANVWGMGSFRLVDRPREYHHLAQFSINLACGGAVEQTKVKLQYSTDLGRTWNLVQSECLPEVCRGHHWAQHTVYESSNNNGWSRVTVPLPPSALSEHTRFRWFEDNRSVTSHWAIDDVYIGSDLNCPGFCSGHGRCTSQGCSCDVNYSGLSCDVTNNNYPSFLSETFDNGVINPKLFDKDLGGQVGFGCGIVGSGKSLVFAASGSRELVTSSLNATNLKFLQFTILMGRYSDTGSCAPPKHLGEGVLVQYSTDGATTWKLLQLVPFIFQRTSRVFTLLLPSDARVAGLQIRWSQQSRDIMAGDAVWALDDVLVTTNLFKTAYSTAVNFHLGELQPYCNRSLVLAFTPSDPHHENRIRYAETQSLHVTSGYVLQAELVIGCGGSPLQGDGRSLAVQGGVELDTELLLEYSLDHGKNWHLVYKLTYPGSTGTTTLFHQASKYHSNEFRQWRRATVALPEETWSDYTRLRIAQPKFDSSIDSWAVDNVYMGPACPMHCMNHGQCRNGGCICDDGYSGAACLPNRNLPTGVGHPFDDVTTMTSRGWRVTGGHVVGSAEGATGWGCDTMTSENYLHFDRAGVRMLVTPDLDTSGGGEIQFYLQIGGGKCKLPTQRSNGVLLQFSLDGGITWYLIQELYYRDFPAPTYVHMGIPPEASDPHTRFRWWQPENQGKNTDRWSIDNVIIGERMASDDATMGLRSLPHAAGLSEQLVEVVNNKGLRLSFSNEGDPRDFCDPKPGSQIFNKLRGDRFVVTDDVFLSQDDVIQFQLNIGCSRNFSRNFAVTLQYSRDGGYSWDYVRHACYPSGRFLTDDDTMTHRAEDVTSSMCTGSGRELVEASKYHVGDYQQWTTIVIPVPRDVAMDTVRFRWMQKVPSNISEGAETPPEWGIASIYIGPACPDHCSGHGLCTQDKGTPKCLCDAGYVETSEGSCAPIVVNPSGFWDKFDQGMISMEWWKRPLGGDIGPGCDASSDKEWLFFNELGSREARTKPLDTSNIRLIQFDLEIGSKVGSGNCATPSGRDESIILQYSNDNGINWHLIKVFRFDGYDSGTSPLVTLDIPYMGKTPSTIFRWWQPLQHKGSSRSAWSISDVMIGRGNMLPSSFYETFGVAGSNPGEAAYDSYDYEAPTGGDLGAHWFKVRGGSPGSFVKCESFDFDPGMTSLVFDDAKPVRFAETWDFYILSGSFLQFDLIMYCDDTYPNNEPVTLQYSTDMGKVWQLVTSQCLPGLDSSTACNPGFGSVYYRKLNKKWTRHTVMLPESLRLSHVRFRWIQESAPSSPIQWALDSVFLGNQCPWMCGGRGYCRPSESGGNYSCSCDLGFEGIPHCQAEQGSLPQSLKDDFNHPWASQDKYSLVVGREPVLSDDLTSVGVMVDGENLQFSRPGVRILQTLALNTSEARYIQFYIHFQPQADKSGNEVVVQSSVNNGITWDTLERVEGKFSQAERLIHIKLPKSARHPATIFRWWSSDVTSEQDEGTWSLDNLVIGGRSSSCDPHQIQDDFDPIQEENWLFVSGGEVGSGCWNSGSEDANDEIVLRSLSSPVDPDHYSPSLVFNSLVSEHSLVTRDLCVVNNDYVIQFMIKIGCYVTAPSSHDVISLEFTVDDGVTWHLVVPHCHDNDAHPQGCSHKRHQASVYYPGSSAGWRRVVVPLKGKHHICTSNSVRFRWHQAKYPDHYSNRDVIQWMVDDVYIGPACDQMCSGHGTCVDGGARCICDVGYTSPTCCDVIEGANPSFFKEAFEHGEVSSSDILWSEVSGGHATNFSTHCDATVVFLRRNYVMNEPGSRVLATRDVDTRTDTFIQFYLKQDSNQKEQIEGMHLSGNPPSRVLFQYSTDGGLTWNMIDDFKFPHSTQTRYVALPLPEGAVSNSTRFRWWQPSKSGRFTLQWALDHVIIGSAKPEIDDDFTESQDSTWLEMTSSEIESSSTCCTTTGGATCRYLHIDSSDPGAQDCGKRWSSTTGVKVTPGSYIQFTAWSGCLATDSCSDLILEYSTDLGHTWALVVRECLPSDTECPTSHGASVYKSDLFLGNQGQVRRVTMPLPEHTWSPETRFRWRLPSGSDVMSWNIDNVYIGSTCPRACSGRGFCHNGACRCDEGWTDRDCRTPTSDLPTDLKDVFNTNYDVIDASPYLTIVGGVVDDVCGDMGFHNALHFNGDCSRLLVTKPLNTSKADYVQFTFRFACHGSAPTNRDQGVMLDFTRNGGVTWSNLHELYYTDHVDKAGFVNILLPDEAKDVGVMFRWRQPRHQGALQQDWAIDNLIISGKKQDKMLSDAFVISERLVDSSGLYLDRDDKDMWRFYDNTEPTSFCGRSDVIKAGVKPGLDASVGTKDFIATEGYILQYTIVVLCQDVQIHHQPVHVQYSLDFGDTWHYMTSQCLPSNPDCYVKEMTQPSAHFVGPDWQRKTIWFQDSLTKRPVRFRFHQNASDVVWALDQLFIGPSCPDACGNRGDCTKEGVSRQRCVCDPGFTGPNCYLNQHTKTYLKDTFNKRSVGNSQWGLMEADKLSSECGHLSDGTALTFEGVGPRQVVTKALDLRDATFVQYRALIGGEGACLPVRDRDDGIILQYTTDGGISWSVLNEVDAYNATGHYYVTLPLVARSNATQLRWWQAFEINPTTGLAGMGADRAGWAIDDVYIGGQEVNVHDLDADLEPSSLPPGNIGPLPDEEFDFFPNAVVGFNQCGGEVGSRDLMWPNHNAESLEQSLTTREMLISTAFQIEFKIKIGCSETTDLCSRDFPVKLQFRENPAYPWQLVRHNCFTSTSPASQCIPFIHYDASVYTLDRTHTWTRVIIPLDKIESGTTQFRWIQRGGASSRYSWALDDIYIGPKCPAYCTGHGKCTRGAKCVCDVGYSGLDCGTLINSAHIRDFRESFELPTPIEEILARAAIAKGAKVPLKWSSIEGGVVGYGGCGSLRPYGYGRTVYFNGCGRREIQTVEMDLVLGGHLHYVIQIGSVTSRSSCRVNTSRSSGQSSVLLEYTTNNGVTWHLMVENRVGHFPKPKLVSVKFGPEMMTPHTKIRWWQPDHGGPGHEQWALDNIEVLMNRENRYLNNLNAPPPLLLSRGRTELPSKPSGGGSAHNVIHPPLLTPP